MLAINFLLAVILLTCTFTTGAKVWTIAPTNRENLENTNLISRYSSLEGPSLWSYGSLPPYCDKESNKNTSHSCSDNFCLGGARPQQDSYIQNTSAADLPTIHPTATPCDRRTAGVGEIANILVRLVVGASVLYGILIAFPIISAFLVYKLSIWSVRYLS